MKRLNIEINNRIYSLLYIWFCGSEEEMQELLRHISINYDEIKAEETYRFQNVLDKNDYKGILKVFNKKNVVGTIGHFIDVTDKTYCKTIINLLKTDRRNSIIELISPYIPTETPR